MSKERFFFFLVPPEGFSPTLAFGVIMGKGGIFRFSFKERRAALYIYPAPGPISFRPVALLEDQRAGHDRAYPADDKFLRFETSFGLSGADERVGRNLLTGLIRRWVKEYVLTPG